MDKQRAPPLCTTDLDPPAAQSHSCTLARSKQTKAKRASKDAKAAAVAATIEAPPAELDADELMNDNPWGNPSPSPASVAVQVEDSPPPVLALELAPDVDEPAGNGWDEPPVVAPVEAEHVLAPVDEAESVADELLEAPLAEPTPDEQVEPDEVPAPTAPLSPLTSPSPAPAHEDAGPPMDDFDLDPPAPLPPPASADDGFDDDDFGPPGGGDDDDFGDFDDNADFAGFGSAPPVAAFAFEQPPPPPAPVAQAGSPAFRLDLSNPTRAALRPLLAPFWAAAYPPVEGTMSDEMERQVEGVGQVLVSEPSRALLASLSSLPPLRPLDWKRSKIRREHLIALGVPVNLDDSADSKPLASLVLPSQQPARLSSGPSSAPARSSSPLPFSSSPFGSRPSTPSEDRRRTANPPPALDKARAAAVCALAEDELLLLGLHELEQLKAEIEAISRYASGALTHALLVREKEVGDGETYHGMIQDLVTAAAKLKASTSSRSGAASPLGRGGATSMWGRKSSGTSAVR